VDNNKSRILASPNDLMFLRDKLKIKVKGYFFSPMYRERRWDGYKRYITEVGGLFSTGLLDQVVELLEKNKYTFEIQDNRKHFYPKNDIRDLGDLELRGDQIEAVEAFLNHKVATN